MAPISVLFLGQSETEYLLNTGSFYRQLAQPTPGNGNLIVYTQNPNGAAPVRALVTAASVAAGLVNPAMAALSAFLAYASPGRQFVVGDGAVAGTGRNQLTNDADTSRLWTDLTSVVTAIETETGAPIQSVIEMWFANDAGDFSNFINTFWPFYFGVLGDGSAFALGATNPVTGLPMDHCLWDGTALATAKGRGLFARSSTAWRMLGLWPRWSGLPTNPTRLASYADQSNNTVQPMRETMRGWPANSFAQSVSMRAGPSAHLCKFGGGSSNIHPDVASPDGQILAVWPFAVEMLRLAGRSLAEPYVVAIEGPTDGTYADLLVALPNGGNLTTLRSLRGLAAPATPVPQQQTVTGVELMRGSVRHPIYRPDASGYDATYKGSVVIQSASETHATHGRVGRVRVTPSTPFAYGNSLSYLMGSAVAALTDTDIDAGLYLDMLLEHIPSLYDSTALYPFPGIAVRPYQDNLVVPVSAPPFVAQSAHFDGASYFNSSSISVAATSSGLFSAWVKNSDSAWNATTRCIATWQISTTVVLSLYTASAGRFSLKLTNETATDIVTFYAAAGSVPFAIGAWYHLLIGWSPSGATIWVNGVQIATMTFTLPDMTGGTLTRVGIGANAAGGQPWLGDIGHLYVNFSATLDLSVQANREKFALAGAPVNLGAAGQTPTGGTPQYYFNGTGPAWTNLGSTGAITRTGTLTAGSTPGYA